MAQRMESAAPPGGVMLSESTARLVEATTTLGEQEMVRHQRSRCAGHRSPADRCRIGHSTVGSATVDIGRPRLGAEHDRGDDRPVDERQGPHRRTGGTAGNRQEPLGRGDSSRLLADRGIQVYTTYCESHTSEIPFHAVARLLRHVFGIDELVGEEARAVVRARLPDAEADDLLLLHDLLGVRDVDVALPDIDPDARRRRLSALLNTAAVARTTPDDLRGRGCPLDRRGQ